MSLDVWLTIKKPVARKGTGVYVRDNGHRRELTPDEVKAKWPDSEIAEQEYTTNDVDNRILPYEGVIACGEWDINSNHYYAEIVPNSGKWYRQFLPSVKRWWFEIHEVEAVPTDDMGIGRITHEYEPYGSGGAWTFRGAVIKARRAIEIAVEKADDQVTAAISTDTDNTQAGVENATKSKTGDT